MLTLDLILGSVKHSKISKMLIEKICNKIFFLLEVCGADWQWDWEAEGWIFSSDLKIPLNKREVVLRNVNVWCNQQVKRYEEN